MTIQVHSDHVSILEAQVRYGICTRFVRRFRVSGLGQSDYTALLTAFAQGDIPPPGSRLPGAPNLVATEHRLTLVDAEKKVADVDVTYEHAKNEGQNFDAPTFGVLLGEMRSTINQVNSNTDKDGNAVTLSHTYPGDDPDFASQTKIQGGQFQVFQPQLTFSLKGMKTTAVPRQFAAALTGKVNAVDFLGGGPGTWICNNCGYEPADGTAPTRFYFTIDFQYNPGGWQPSVAFEDERTNKPPVGLVEGVGIKTVEKYSSVDFESVIGARVQGG